MVDANGGASTLCGCALISAGNKGSALAIAKNCPFRVHAAIIVAITFVNSAVVLIMAEKIGFAIVTFIALLMLGVVMKQSLNKPSPVPT